MNKLKNKTVIIAIATILVLSMTMSMTLVPSVHAHTPPISIPTYASLSVEPNPIGLGQTAYVGFWLDKVPPTAYQQYGDRWQNFTLTVTNPDKTTSTLGPFTSDDTGGSHTTFVPSKTGNYTFVFNFPGQTLAGYNPSPIIGSYYAAFIGDYFEPSTSAPVTLTVTTTQVTTQATTSVPTGYWQNPIESFNVNWYTISGNWLGYTAGAGGGGSGGAYYNNTENFNPYTTAPNSAHITWTQPYSFGGLIGGQFGGTTYGSNYNSNNQYQPKMGAIVMNGVVYYTLVPGSTANQAGWVALDLRTGQTLWTKNTTAVLKTGQILDYISPNQYGAFAYLWALPQNPYYGTTSGAPQYNNTWQMYDAMTGKYILSIVNGPSSPTTIKPGLVIPIALIPTLATDQNGNLLGYYVNSTSNTLNMWNSTLAIATYDLQTGRDVNTWTWAPPQGANINWNLGIQWSVPLATKVTLSNGTITNMSPGLAISKLASGVVLMTSTPVVGGYYWQAGYIYEAAYSAQTGQLLWGPLVRTEAPWTRLFSPIASAALNGIYYEFTMETMTFNAYSLTTGKLVWGPVALTNYVHNDTYGYFDQSMIVAYGTLYMADLGGYVYALNATTGAFMWDFYTGGAGLQTPYGEYPIFNIAGAADGKVFVEGGHNYSPPLFAGGLLYCLNGTTGKLVWDIPNFVVTNQPDCAIVGGSLLMPNAYDNQLYCFGKGLSATTVNVTPTINNDKQVLITGTVTDQSPGKTCLGIPEAGTPAIADAYMTPWMEYLYMQQPEPTNATGVQVTLSYVDPNNNTYTTGTTTSDITGHYSYAFTPTVPGTYKIIATFGGTNSYFSSQSETSFRFAQPATTTAPTATPTSVADQYFTPAIAALAVIMIIGFAILAVLALRKRA